MKTTIPLLLFALIFASSCSQECDCSHLYSKSGLYYHKDTKKIYSGTCVYVFGNGDVRYKKEINEGKVVSEKSFTETGNVWKEILYDKAGDRISYISYYIDENKELINKDTEIYYKRGKAISKKSWYKMDGFPIHWDVEYYGIIDPSAAYSNNTGLSYVSCKPGSKIYFENGKVKAEVFEPIKFTDKYNRTLLVKAVEYWPSGTIKVLSYEVNGIGHIFQDIPKTDLNEAMEFALADPRY